MNAVAAAGMAAALLPASTRAQESSNSPQPSATRPAAPGPARQNTFIPTDLDDLAFDRFVDLRLVARAWRTQEPGLLTDVGLQLAEGERVLLRLHKALDSGAVLELAAYLAAEHDDGATLARLDKAADGQDRTWRARLKSAQELGARCRAHLPAVRNIESLTPEGLMVHQAALRRIRTARLSGDLRAIEELDKEIDRRPEMTAHQQEHLDKVIEKAKSAVSKERTALRSTIQTMDRLSDIYSDLEHTH
jgi:hypothetical protein